MVQRNLLSHIQGWSVFKIKAVGSSEMLAFLPKDCTLWKYTFLLVKEILIILSWFVLDPLRWWKLSLQHFLFLRQNLMTLTHQTNWCRSNTLPLQLESTWFKSWSDYWLSWLRCLVFLKLTGQISGVYQLIDHDQVLCDFLICSPFITIFLF